MTTSSDPAIQVLQDALIAGTLDPDDSPLVTELIDNGDLEFCSLMNPANQHASLGKDNWPYPDVPPCLCGYDHVCPECGGYLEDRGDTVTCERCGWSPA